jgi:hypothetical protein
MSSAYQVTVEKAALVSDVATALGQAHSNRATVRRT